MMTPTPSNPASPEIDRISRDCLCNRLRQLNRIITGLYDDALRPLGLKASQLSLLVAIGRIGLARPATLCRLLDLDPSTLSRNVDRLRAKRWVETVPTPDDARAQPLRLTPAGQALIQRAAPAWQTAQDRAAQLLGPAAPALRSALSNTTTLPPPKTV